MCTAEFAAGDHGGGCTVSYGLTDPTASWGPRCTCRYPGAHTCMCTCTRGDHGVTGACGGSRDGDRGSPGAAVRPHMERPPCPAGSEAGEAVGLRGPCFAHGVC